MAHLEAYKAATDSKLQEKDASLSKTKEESAFQRHTISDLKNQLNQLQSEMEEQEMDKQDDLEQLLQDFDTDPNDDVSEEDSDDGGHEFNDVSGEQPTFNSYRDEYCL